MVLLKGRKMVLKAFDSGIFSKINESKYSRDPNNTDSTDKTLLTLIKKGSRLKILTPKQIIQRLPIALAQAEAGNKSENLLNEIKEIVYSLYWSKEITKKVYNNIIKSMKI